MQTLTQAAAEGYHSADDAQSPYLWSSPADMAWMIGRWAKKSGRSLPHSVRQSRGYTFRVEFMRNAPIQVRWHGDGMICRVKA